MNTYMNTYKYLFKCECLCMESVVVIMSSLLVILRHSKVSMSLMD